MLGYMVCSDTLVDTYVRIHGLLGYSCGYIYMYGHVRRLLWIHMVC